MYLGEIIKNYRQTNNISMNDFAKLANLSKPYISMLEKNKNSRSGKPIIPSVVTLKKVAKAMNISFDDLIKQLDAGQEILLSPPSRLSQNDFITSAEEQSLIKKYRCLSPEGKTAVKATVDSLYNTTIQSKIKDESAG